MKLPLWIFYSWIMKIRVSRIEKTNHAKSCVALRRFGLEGGFLTREPSRALERATAEARVYHRHSRLLNADERREARGQAALCLPLLPMSAARPAIFGHTVFQVQHIQCDSFTRGKG